MSRSEKSIAIPTGMIIAALYVVLLVGFSRESYMRRDAVLRTALEKSGARISGPDRRCEGNQAACDGLLPASADPQACVAPIDRLHQLAGDSVPSLGLRELQRALGTDP